MERSELELYSLFYKHKIITWEFVLVSHHSLLYSLQVLACAGYVFKVSLGKNICLFDLLLFGLTKIRELVP